MVQYFFTSNLEVLFAVLFTKSGQAGTGFVSLFRFLRGRQKVCNNFHGTVPDGFCQCNKIFAVVIQILPVSYGQD